MVNRNTILQLLTESATSSAIIDAINGKKLVNITYDGNDSKGMRLVEPISYGINSYGNPVLRAWQINGNSETYDNNKHKKNDPLTRISGYRMFNVNKILSFVPTDELSRADKTFIRNNRPKHNKYMGWEDKDMDKIIASVDLSKNIDSEYIFNTSKDKLLKSNKIDNKIKNNIRKADYNGFISHMTNNRDSYEKFTSQNVKAKNAVNYLTKVINRKK